MVALSSGGSRGDRLNTAVVLSVILHFNAAVSGEGQKYGCIVITGKINV